MSEDDATTLEQAAEKQLAEETVQKVIMLHPVGS